MDDSSLSATTELVRTVTEDGLRLDGVLRTVARSPMADLDAILLLHGVGGNFYGGVLFDEIAAAAHAIGVDVLRVNTRGHDGAFVSKTQGGRGWFGAAFEIVAEATWDIAAWVRFLQQREYSRIGLLGHSLGAIKALFSQSQAPDEAVTRVIAMSPPRLSYQRFASSERRDDFLACIAQAESLVHAGRAEAVFSACFPFPLLISARAYLDKYGPQERYDIVRFINRVPQPLLVLYGEKELAEGGVAFSGLLETLAATPDLSEKAEFAVIEGADHSYSEGLAAATQRLRQWLCTSTS